MPSIPVPDYNPPGYDVNYQGTMELVEVPAVGDEVKTKINWQMHLGVRVRFPQFVYKLPLSLIQTTGVLRRAQIRASAGRLLEQIVRQISPRLTYRVQKDFHSRFHLPIPNDCCRKLHKIPRPTAVG